MLNEASTMSSKQLGVTDTQLKAIYTDSSKKFLEVIPRADATWTYVKSKADLKKHLASKEYLFDGRKYVILVTNDKDEMLVISSNAHLGTSAISYSVNGSQISRFDKIKSVSKLVSLITGTNNDIHITANINDNSSMNSTIKRDKENSMTARDFANQNESTAIDIFNKKIEPIIKEKVDQIIKTVSGGTKQDLGKAYIMIQKIVDVYGSAGKIDSVEWTRVIENSRKNIHHLLEYAISDSLAYTFKKDQLTSTIKNKAIASAISKALDEVRKKLGD